MSGVWLPSLGQVAWWTVKAAAVVTVAGLVAWLWLGWTGRKWS